MIRRSPIIDINDIEDGILTMMNVKDGFIILEHFIQFVTINDNGTITKKTEIDTYPNDPRIILGLINNIRHS